MYSTLYFKLQTTVQYIQNSEWILRATEYKVHSTLTGEKYYFTLHALDKTSHLLDTLDSSLVTTLGLSTLLGHQCRSVPEDQHAGKPGDKSYASAP